MSSVPDSDRNLLFGILALQMDFISRDALVAAMHAWVLDKTRPLGLILHEQGDLAEDERALLDGLVRKHLEKHNNQPQQSLAALSSVRSARQELLQVADADVQASLAHVGADRGPDDLEATRDDAERPVGPAGLRFRILRPHARGGLGEVFVARDEELKREVALKEIQTRHADQPESRARFLLEAEVTGGLEHPGIVPVYGLGTYADGRPFYAMRFIKGDSLKDAIAAFHAAQSRGQSDSERSLGLRQLLGRFVDVCNAIAYAHSRGVLHRDLKPGNVMLGKYGETLVVDWGLAKVLGQADGETTEGVLTSSGDSALTQAGRALGTPAFMSPEQATGRLDRLGPASDVYSLGATLYCLLTGRAPFAEADVGAVLGKVERGDFPRPREVRSDIPAPLEAVCLKAMALKPEDRYASAKDLADEVERWLADEPVRAWREPWRVRLGRWRRRHPALVTGTAALAVTALVAVAVGGLLLSQEQAKTLNEQQAKIEQQRKAREAQEGRAVAQVDALLDATPQAVPAILDGLRPYPEEVRHRLREAADRPRPQGVTEESLRVWRQHRTRAALALLPDEPGRVKFLSGRLLDRELTPQEMLLVRDHLGKHGASLAESLWQQATRAGSKDTVRFRALVALAAYDPGSSGWQKAGTDAVRGLLSEDPFYLGAWVKALRPVRQHLRLPLAKVFRGEEKSLVEYRQVAANVLADYADDQPDLLADLLLAADPRQYAVLFPVLQAHRERAAQRMRAELARVADDWKDPRLDPSWKGVCPRNFVARSRERAASWRNAGRCVRHCRPTGSRL
jgi:serine/threonine protein kinase